MDKDFFNSIDPELTLQAAAEQRQHEKHVHHAVLIEGGKRWDDAVVVRRDLHKIQRARCGKLTALSLGLVPARWCPKRCSSSPFSPLQ